MKTDVWLDTTALIDLEFRSFSLRQHILSLLPADNSLHTSRYVLFELARGFLPRLIRLYNKASELDSLSDLMQYISNCGVGSSRVMSSMTNAYADYIRHEESLGTSLTPSQQLAHFRGWLGPMIRRGWRAIQRYSVLNSIGCQDHLPAPVAKPIHLGDKEREQFSHALPTKQCGLPGNCGLISNLQSAAGDFGRITQHLVGLPKPDIETSKRITALQLLLQHSPAESFGCKSCFDCGDAIIAQEAPVAHLVLSKNEKHYQPLCDALQKPLRCYKEPKTALKS